MSQARTSSILFALLCLGPSALPGARPDRLPPSTRLVLDNGFEAILIPNGAAPLIASVVVVRAGVIHETPAVNGVSHMLEHLLFNGTARRTQEEIYDEQDRYGIINNASTGAEQTAYFVMAARETAARALDLQADMLFGSVFPEDKLAKEREIIVNEIAKDSVSDETVMSDLFSARLYHPSGLAMPVIGTPESVRQLPREAILSHYRARYAPNNMTAVIMGDFEIPWMETLVRRCFGAAAPRELPPPPPLRVNQAALGLAHTRRTGGGARLLWLGAPAPGIESDSFGAAHLLASLLGEGLVEAVNARLRAMKAIGSFLDASAGLDAHRSASIIQVRALLEPDLQWEDAAGALLAEVTERLSSVPWKTPSLDRVRLGERASMMRLWEKPHYFGLDRAPCIAAAGWEAARDFLRRLAWVEPADLKDAARRLADRKAWALFEVGPDAPEDRGSVAASGGGAGEGAGRNEPTQESRALVARWKGPGSSEPTGPPSPAAPPDEPSGDPPRGSVTARAVLPNGMTIIMDSTDDSRVFAAHVLVRNRSAAEPPGRAGIAEILHRLAGAATREHTHLALEGALGAIGGTLKVTDEAAIPYDDIYLSPEYTYIRLEALDEFATEALDLLREILYEPEMSIGASLEASREQLLARIRQSGDSPRDRCRLLMAGGVWGEGHPFASPLFGSEATVRAITAADVKAFHETYFSPRNLIVAIGTSVRPEKLLPIVEAKLGRWPSPGRAAKPPAPASPTPATLAAAEADSAGGPLLLAGTLGSSQAYLMLARLAPPGPRADAAFDALAAVLTRRMGDTLREKRGLSYSLGADATRLAGRIQFTLSMGTLPEKVEEARSGLREILLSLLSSPPSQQEVDDAVRATQVRVRMRALSRINRGWQRSLDEYRRSQSAAAPGAEPAPSGPVTADQVLTGARRLMPAGDLEGWVEAVVAPSPPAALR
jgi:zinc protease